MHVIFGIINNEDVKRVYFYVGSYAKDKALQIARNLAGQKNKLTLVACDCYSEDKQKVANSLNVPIIWSDCGGRRTLGDIVTKELVD